MALSRDCRNLSDGDDVDDDDGDGDGAVGGGGGDGGDGDGDEDDMVDLWFRPSMLKWTNETCGWCAVAKWTYFRTCVGRGG